MQRIRETTDVAIASACRRNLAGKADGTRDAFTTTSCA
jgi:hypothetical protein